ncbi:MAG TPA: hypothetical protein PKU97_09150, partial [Kofleriaceae bacterium]|nr:hypothetical protein [Kofleriaceae bacterium]
MPSDKSWLVEQRRREVAPVASVRGRGSRAKGRSVLGHVAQLGAPAWGRLWARWPVVSAGLRRPPGGGARGRRGGLGPHRG